VKEIASRAGDDSYYGILMIDGDSMGNAISGLGKRGQQALSQRLSMFASGIRENLDRLSCMPVFAGGDELIAMIPLHRVVQTMEAVQNTFREIVCVDGANFTISAGLAIVHEMEPLDGARELAQKAKKSAKELTGKNALCITEAPRSGAAVSVAGRWDWMLPRLRKIVTAYAAKKLSYGFGHELWDVLHRTPNEIEEARPDLAMALAKHKRESNSAAAELVDANRDRLDDLMALMLVARKVARAGGAANL
jgi:CRISPR-associated protein Cmr2